MKPDDFAELIVSTIKRSLLGPLCGGRLDAIEQQLATAETRLLELEARLATLPADEDTVRPR